MSSIAIIDYGMGNLRSVQKALEKVGSTATITSDADRIASADKVILPGVGAFRDAIQALRDHRLIDVIHQSVDSGRPFLGICLGMQLLLERSFEDGEYEGLGIIPGSVRRFDVDPSLKIPHMGWNQLSITDDANPLFADADPSAWYYFVHSYYVDPADGSWTAATSDYGGHFTASVRRENVFATQFHPEKSQSAGLLLLKNFVQL
jgi:glutamine amidotransferase